jgi:flagellar motor component MotA
MEVNDKVKKVAKYVTNILGMIGALIIGINAVEGITIPYALQISQIIIVIQGIIGTYLLGDKAKSKIEEKKEDTKNG